MPVTAGIPAVTGILTSVLTVMTVVLWGHLRAAQLVLRRERRRLNEIGAYLLLDTRVGKAGGMGELAERVCAVISARSPFRRVAMLLRDPEGRLYVAANSEMEPRTVGLVQQWAAAEEEGLDEGRAETQAGVRLGRRSFVTGLGYGAERWVFVPFCTSAGRGLGGLVVMGANVLNVRREMAEEAVVSLEALGTRLAYSLEDAESELLRGESFANFGLLVEEIAHTLNNPLTVVMEQADLIGQTASEEHVRNEAHSILNEARRMRDRVESLIRRWQFPSQKEDGANVGGHEVA